MAKERFWSKKSPEEKWDYIVIGSGMGGMTTAAILSHLEKVLVLEQHYVPGGFTHTFRREVMNGMWVFMLLEK